MRRFVRLLRKPLCLLLALCLAVGGVTAFAESDGSKAAATPADSRAVEEVKSEYVSDIIFAFQQAGTDATKVKHSYSNGFPGINSPWKDSTPNNGGIIIGGLVDQGGKSYDKGLGVFCDDAETEKVGHPGYTIVDISEYTAQGYDRFSALTGISNNKTSYYPSATDKGWAGHDNNGVSFEVWASTSDAANVAEVPADSFKKLGETDTLHRTDVAAINVSLASGSDTPYRWLKLVCNKPGDKISGGNSAWVNPVLYKAPENPEDVQAAFVGQTNVAKNTTTDAYLIETKVGEFSTYYTWHDMDLKVTGNASAQTKVENGKLTVAADETAAELTLEATLTYTENKKVTVTQKITVPGFTHVSSPNGFKTLDPNTTKYLVDPALAELVDMKTDFAAGPWSFCNDGRTNSWIGGQSGTANGKQFTVGMAGAPKAFNVYEKTGAYETHGAATAIFDVSKLDCNRFYAAVGITNGNGQGSVYNVIQGSGITQYEVYGTRSADSSDFELLAASDVIRGATVGEFDLDISGIYKVKLVLRGAGNSNSYCDSLWGNICVYGASEYEVNVTGDAQVTQGQSAQYTLDVKKDGQPIEVPETVEWTLNGGSKAGTKIEAGKLTVDPEEDYGTVLTLSAKVTVNGKEYQSLPYEVTVESRFDNYKELTAEDSFRTEPSGAKFLSDMIEGCEHSYGDSGNTKNPNNGMPYKDCMWQGSGDPNLITFSAAPGNLKTVKFAKGLGVHPQAFDSKNAVETDHGMVYSIFDVSNLNMNRFYSVVGLTNPNGHVRFYVYGTRSAGSNNYELLAESGVIQKDAQNVTNIGEFDVDITGIYKLKLVLRGTGTSYASCGSAWANACLYNTKDQTEYTISVGGPENAKQGETVDMTTTVTKNGKPYTVEEGAQYTWTVTGNTSKGTTISNDGKLTIGEDEPVGAVLNITVKLTIGGVDVTGTKELAVLSASSNYQKVTTFKTLPSKVTYLSDIDWVVSLSNDFKPAVRNGLWASGATPIYLGGTAGDGKINDGTKFDKGLGMQPFDPKVAPDNGAAYTVYNVKGMNVDRFYAAVGITNQLGQDGSGYGVIFQVYGAKTAAIDPEYILLSESDPILGVTTGEFEVNIAGYEMIKLVIKCAGTSTGYCNSMWANACVYNSKDTDTPPVVDPTDPTDPEPTTPADPAETPKYPDAFKVTTSPTKPAGSTMYLSDLKASESVYADGKTEFKDQGFNGGKIMLGGTSGDGKYDGLTFTKGLGVGPRNPATAGGMGEAWTIYDISSVGAKTFYAVVGIVNLRGQDGDCPGVIFDVFGSPDASGNNWQLLATSGDVTRTTMKEINISVEGLKRLKLQVKNSSGYAFNNSAWADACLIGGKSGPAPGTTTNTNNNKPTKPNRTDYTGWKDGYFKITDMFLGLPFTATLNGHYLSDLPFVESVNLGGAQAIRDGLWSSGATPIYIGGTAGDNSITDGFTFAKGLGVQPQDPSTAPDDGASWTIFDLSSMKVDTFYAAVGITNQGGQDGKSLGVEFLVYGGETKDGEYKLLAESGPILGVDTGEFSVPITGYNFLKLVIRCFGNSHGFCNSMWADAIVYDSTDTSIPKPSEPDDSKVPTLPDHNATEPEASEETQPTEIPSQEKPNPTGIYIGAGVAVVLALGIAIAAGVVTSKKKKKQ